MQPVQHFKTNFLSEQIADTASDNLMGYAISNTELHDTDSNVRNLCLVWDDKRRAFFNYAYLVSVDLVLTDNLNVILLYFSGQIVTLKGYQLGLLFDLLLNHSPQRITASKPRYYTDEQTQISFVTEIHVKSE